MRTVLDAMIGDLPLPVLVCRLQGNFPVVYANTRAGLMFSPTRSSEGLAQQLSQGKLQDYLCRREEDEGFWQTLEAQGRAGGFNSRARTFDGREVPVRVWAGHISWQGGEYMMVVLVEAPVSTRGTSMEERLAAIISTALLDPDIDSAIGQVLAMAGRQMKVSRVYIFEEVSPQMTRNTYEWCAEGVAPAIQDLQQLPKEEYSYDVIINSGMFVVGDVGTMPNKDRHILEPQGIRALAIIPMFDRDTPLGYVGFDDTQKVRQWSRREVDFLQNTAILLASLLKRRNTEQRLHNSRRILQLVTDNSVDNTYVNSLGDYKLLFVSRALAATLGTTPEQLEGKPCWQVLHPGDTAPCKSCPIPQLSLPAGSPRGEVLEGESHNRHTGRHYLAKDSLIRWTTGQTVHMQVATDITERIEYEEKLRYLACNDAMTGLYNRQWGSDVMAHCVQKEGCLCFIDVDGLKRTNDQNGHAAGDEMLTVTARMLAEALDEDDIGCRWGGDEFLLWSPRSVDEMDALMHRVQAKMEQYNQTANKPFVLSFSYGIVGGGAESGRTLDELVMEADQRMYQSKMEKRGKMRKRRRDDRLG